MMFANASCPRLAENDADDQNFLRKPGQIMATSATEVQKVPVATWSELEDRQPAYALVGEVDLVVIRYDDQVSVLFGRCLHRAALMSDGYVDGDNLFCGVHHWDYRLDSGVSEYNNEEALHKFTAWVEDDSVLVDENEIRQFQAKHPQPYNRNEYLGLYQEHHNSDEEPHNGYIQSLAKKGNGAKHKS